jgi:prepilin-type N-terminal cleavage/methylation domain-containing protein
MILNRKQNKCRRSGFTLIEVLISFAILVTVTSGLIFGYVQLNRTATWSSWSLAAQSLASEGLEQARAAQWYESGSIDQWPPTTNLLGVVVPFQTNCTLDVPTSGQPISVTNYVTITSYSANPPIREIRSDCVWNCPLTGQLCTNTLITLRSPDQ